MKNLLAITAVLAVAACSAPQVAQELPSAPSKHDVLVAATADCAADDECKAEAALAAASTVVEKALAAGSTSTSTGTEEVTVEK